MAKAKRKQQRAKNNNYDNVENLWDISKDNKRNRRIPVWDRKPIKGLNHKQDEYLQALRNHSTIASVGVAGSGKTWLAAQVAADMLEDPNNPIEKIVIARPAEGAAATIGLLPGDKNEKLEGWVAPVAEALKSRMGKYSYEGYLKAGLIELLPLEQVRGHTFNNTFTIVDEAQNLSVDTIKCLLTRVGNDCRLVINGDVAQKDVKGDCGLMVLFKLFENFKNVPAAMVNFDSWDYCVRSDAARYFGEALEALERDKII